MPYGIGDFLLHLNFDYYIGAADHYSIFNIHYSIALRLQSATYVSSTRFIISE